MDNDSLPELPKGWVWATFGNVAYYINGRAFKPSEWEKSGRPIIRIQNLTGSTNTINRYSKPVEDKFLVRNEEFLIAWSATLGAFIYKGEEAVLNQHIFKVQTYIDRMFLFYLTTRYIETLKQKVHGTGMQHITKKKFEEIPIPLPPLTEQNRIVPKIEELFTKLDAGVEGVKKVKAQLKRYRQSILKAAVEGKLTKEWREAHKGELEPASVLLERILKERREKWEADQLARMKTKGKMPKDDKWKKRYKEPVAPDTSDLRNLPEGWIWATVEQISTKVQYGSSTKTNNDPSGVPILRMGNIVEGRLILNDLKYLPKEHKEFPELFLEPDDLLFNRTNSPELVGKTAVYTGTPNPCSFASYLIRVRLNHGVYPPLLSYYINSVHGRNWISSVVSQQVGQANVNGTKLQALVVPLPSKDEQHAIVEEVERRLSIAEEIETAIETNLKQAERLRQSILKKAFKGKLVPQDPSDERADKLLERIKAEKAKRETEDKMNKKHARRVVPKQMRLI